MLLAHAGKKPRNVLERDERNVEGVAEADEPRALDRRVDVETSGENGGLIGHNPGGPPAHTCEADDQVRREMLMNFQKRPIVYDRANEIVHVIGLIRLLWDQAVERVIFAIERIAGRGARRIVQVV